MKRIAVVTDSSADISTQQALDLGVHVVRMPLLINNTEHTENETITLEEFTLKMEQGAIVKTSQPAIGKLTALWDQLLMDYDELI